MNSRKYSWLEDFGPKNPVDGRLFKKRVLQLNNGNFKKPSNPKFGFSVNDCPESLKLFVKVYRCIGFSFSGITFRENGAKLNYGSKKLDSKSDSTLSSLLLIGVNILAAAVCLTPYFMAQNTSDLNPNSSYTNTDFEHELTLSLAEYKKGFVDFKPILRMVMEFIIYVFTVDGWINYIANLLTGGRLIRQLSQIPHHFDSNRSLAIRFLVINCLLIVAVYLVAISLFSLKQLQVLFAITFGLELEPPPSIEDVRQAKRIFMILLFHCIYFVVLSVLPCLFIYTMFIFTKQITKISEEVDNSDLDELRLTKIKTKLADLSVHFRATLSYFSLPITVINISNIYLIISSACYLMISPERQRHFCSFVCIFGLFGLLRLALICYAGNLATNAYRDLIRQLYEQMPEWTLPAWLCFDEIKRIRGKFKATILSTYTVRQSAILTMLGFALNYIVVLLQTENYGSVAHIKARNVTLD